VPKAIRQAGVGSGKLGNGIEFAIAGIGTRIERATKSLSIFWACSRDRLPANKPYTIRELVMMYEPRFFRKRLAECYSHPLPNGPHASRRRAFRAPCTPTWLIWCPFACISAAMALSDRP